MTRWQNTDWIITLLTQAHSVTHLQQSNERYYQIITEYGGISDDHFSANRPIHKKCQWQNFKNMLIFAEVIFSAKPDTILDNKCKSKLLMFKLT